MACDFMRLYSILPSLGFSMMKYVVVALFVFLASIMVSFVAFFFISMNKAAPWQSTLEK